MVKSVSRISSLTFLFLVVVVISSGQEPKSSGTKAEPEDSARQTLAVPEDSSRWKLEGKVKTAEYLGRRALLIDGGTATFERF